MFKQYTIPKTTYIIIMKKVIYNYKKKERDNKLTQEKNKVRIRAYQTFIIQHLTSITIIGCMCEQTLQDHLQEKLLEFIQSTFDMVKIMKDRVF